MYTAKLKGREKRLRNILKEGGLERLPFPIRDKGSFTPSAAGRPDSAGLAFICKCNFRLASRNRVRFVFRVPRIRMAKAICATLAAPTAADSAVLTSSGSWIGSVRANRYTCQ